MHFSCNADFELFVGSSEDVYIFLVDAHAHGAGIFARH